MEYISLVKKADEKLRFGKYKEAKNCLKKPVFKQKNKNRSFIDFLGELQSLGSSYESSVHHYKKAVELAIENDFNHFSSKLWELA